MTYCFIESTLCWIDLLITVILCFVVFDFDYIPEATMRVPALSLPLLLGWTMMASVDAFVPPARHTPLSTKTVSVTSLPFSSASLSSSSAFGRMSVPYAAFESSSTRLRLGGGEGAILVDAVSSSSSSSMSPLMTYFVQALIANGVPALFSIIVIGFAAFMIGKAASSSRRRNNGTGGELDDLLETRNPVAQLYNDLYGDQNQDYYNNNRNMPFFFGPGGGANNNKLKLPRNAGIPDKEYLKITHWNRQLDSYRYSLQAATQSKAAAAAQFRQSSFARALGKALPPSLVVATSSNDSGTVATTATATMRQELLQAEADFLKEAAKVTQDITTIQTQLTTATVDQQLEAFGMKSVYDLDASYNATTNETVATVVVPNKQSKFFNKGELLSKLATKQRKLQELELDFIQKVVQTVGPEYGSAVRTALLGDVAVRGSGGLLQALQERPLRTLLQGDTSSTTTSTTTPGNLYVTRFPGDASASQVATLRQEATAIIRSAQAGVDEVMVILQTGGGTVTGYGLAAAQLLRFKQAGLKLTVAVEQVSASGGYMM